MGTIQKINWRNPVLLLGLFCGAALLLSLAWNVLQAVHKDPEPPSTVLLTHEQIRAINEPRRIADSIQYAKQEAKDQLLLRAATRSIQASDSLHSFFDKQQTLRDEKYNHALSASDADNIRLWSKWYDGR